MIRALAAVLLIACISCTDSKQVSDDVIGKEKMEKIMWDMLQADRYVNLYINPDKDSSLEKKKEAAIFYERVFQLHGITRDEFLKSYKFYLGRPDITKVLFDSISTRADKRRAEVYSGKKNPFLEKRDSLRRVDSLRQLDSVQVMDSINQSDSASTSELSDSAIREMLNQ